MVDDENRKPGAPAGDDSSGKIEMEDVFKEWDAPLDDFEADDASQPQAASTNFDELSAGAIPGFEVSAAPSADPEPEPELEPNSGEEPTHEFSDLSWENPNLVSEVDEFEVDDLETDDDEPPYLEEATDSVSLDQLSRAALGDDEQTPIVAPEATLEPELAPVDEATATSATADPDTPPPPRSPSLTNEAAALFSEGESETPEGDAQPLQAVEPPTAPAAEAEFFRSAAPNPVDTHPELQHPTEATPIPALEAELTSSNTTETLEAGTETERDPPTEATPTPAYELDVAPSVTPDAADAPREPESPAEAAPDPAPLAEPVTAVPAGEPASAKPIGAPQDPQPTDSSPPRIDPLPIDRLPQTDGPSWVTDFKLFQNETQKLARLGNWRRLAAVTGHVLLNAPFAARGTKAALLLDLAQLYRDRLKDLKRAEQAFAALTEADPANTEAIGFLREVYEKRGDWEKVYELFLAAVEATWAPKDRLEWTEGAARIAMERMQRTDLAINAWERLWRLGDAVEESSRALSRYYRLAGRWTEMATFLEQQTARLDGASQLVVLRELAEVQLSGIRSADEAGRILETIVERSPQDPIAPFQLARVYAQRSDWEGLERLGTQAAETEQTDLQHIVADTLWQAGRLEQAVEAYDRILKVDPTHREAIACKHEYLTRTGRYEELLQLLVESADTSQDEREKASLLRQAAKMADKQLDKPQQAIELWEAWIGLNPTENEGFEALSRLCDKVGDLDGAARALQGQLNLVKRSTERVELLRRLGSHYATGLEDDDRAEECWKEILSLDSSDLAARQDLIGLHRRRGNFEALNSALMRQIWLTSDTQRAESLCRLAAENLDENFDDAERSVEAWRRVLDFAPMDLQALQTVGDHYATLGDNRGLIATLERQIAAVTETRERVSIALRVAGLWELEGVPTGAAAAYERVLRWDPNEPEALEALVRIYQDKGQHGQAHGLLEFVGTQAAEDRRQELMRRHLDLLPPEEHLRRFRQLHRLLNATNNDPGVLEDLRKEAQAAALWPEMAAVVGQLACNEAEPSTRIAHLTELAQICDKELKDPARAFVTLQAGLLSPGEHQAVLEALQELAQRTNRHEDLLAVLDGLTTPEFELEQRKRTFEQRARICEKDLKDPLRAFLEHRRRLELDPTDWAPLADLQKLCDKFGDKHKLWPRFDAVYAELWDHTRDKAEQLDLLARREAIMREHLDEPNRAFALLVSRYRLDSDDGELLQRLIEDADELEAWEWLLPVLEATEMADTDREGPLPELGAIAALYQEKAQDFDRAFALNSAILLANPTDDEVAERLEELAAKTKRHQELAEVLRSAAALTDDPSLRIRLLKRIAQIYEEMVQAPDRAIDIHRRLLELNAKDTSSLKVMLAWHRKRSEWRDLRDRLHQWLDTTPADAERTDELMEVAKIGQLYLADPEAALEAYGKVLELAPDHSEARSGLEGLVSSISEPRLRRRWMQMQLASAGGTEAVKLHLELAQIFETDLHDPAAATSTLEALVEQDGAAGDGFAPLARLYRETSQYLQLVRLLQQRADQLSDPSEKLATYEQAIQICHEHVPSEESALREQLYRCVLELRPDDRDAAVRLARVLRADGRFDELASLLDAQLGRLPDASRATQLYEIARLYSHNLDRPDEAQRIQQRLVAEFPREEGALLGLARHARESADTTGYIELRKQQAALLEPQEGALVICHLAEVCDETPGLEERMVPLYREARALDPDNVPAMEALKGIGRRLKTLRPAAALLPLDGERDLQPTQRAERLRALGTETLESDLLAAIDWFRRAVAIDPDSPDNWGALADALQGVPDFSQAYRARRGYLQAQQRIDPVTQNGLEEARALHDLATAAKRAGELDRSAALAERAFELAPSYAPAALATAEVLLEQDNAEGAQRLLHEVLEQHRTDLNTSQLVAAWYCHGVALQRLGESDKALENFRSALSLDPLHAQNLVATGALLAQKGHLAAAMENHIRALMVLEEPLDRGHQYFQLGQLLEDQMGRADEAGACYELALAEGLEQRELFHRALKHYQRSGRLEESLDVVEGLLPSADEPAELATLWLVRGEILSDREDHEDEAIEAFDMALSYDPGSTAARRGLVGVLEKRGDWNQVLQVLEASCEMGDAPQRADALLRMATISIDRLADTQKAEEYLRQSVSTHPNMEALVQLEELYGDDKARQDERAEVVGLLVGFGPPWFDRCLELGKLLLTHNQRWAWCLLSPLLGVSQIEAETKGILQDMRKEFERPGLSSPYTDSETHALLAHPQAHPQIQEVLAELLETIPDLGLCSIDQTGDSAAIAIGGHTSLGRKFAALAEPAGLPSCSLHRTQSLQENVVIVNEPGGPRVVVRTDVMQQLVHAEVGFLFGYALELSRPGPRTMAVLPPEQRELLLPALWSVLGFQQAKADPITELAARIDGAIDDAQRNRWSEQLASFADLDPHEIGQQWWTAVRCVARRAGLLAGPDLRQIFRVVARIEKDIERPRVVARITELDEYVGSSEILRDIVAFAAAPAFGKLLERATAVTVE